MSTKTTKRILLRTLVIFGLASIAAILSLFVKSMTVSEQARSARSQYDISSLESGRYMLVDLNRENAWEEKVLIVKDWSNNIYVHLVPAKNNRVVMPDINWGWGYYYCRDFRPDTDADGRLVKQGLIRCHDQEAHGIGYGRWQWEYSGRARIEWMSDMHSPDFEIRSGVLYVNR